MDTKYTKSSDTTGRLAPSKNQEEEHLVVRGENLWKIARRQLKEHGKDGSPNAIMNRIHSIIDANKDQYPGLANDPNLIVPGMKLKLPTNDSATPHGDSDSGSGPHKNPERTGARRSKQATAEEKRPPCQSDTLDNTIAPDNNSPNPPDTNLTCATITLGPPAATPTTLSR